MQEIGNGIFYQSGIEASELPDAITVIPDGTYQCCTNLADFTVGNNVTEIEKEAFYWCFALKSIRFGEKVAKIGADAFLKDDAIRDVVCLNPEPATGASFPQEVYDNAQLLVPDGALEAYRAAPGWKEFKNITTPIILGVDSAAAVSPFSIDGRTVTLLEAGSIVDAAGRTLLNGAGSIELESGIYIISTATRTLKIRL